jgi:hypothetical protein
MDTTMAQLIERLGSFGLLGVVLFYFLQRYERLFKDLTTALTLNSTRLTRIEIKLGIQDEEGKP